MESKNDSGYPILFECAKLFDVQENTPGAGGETPSFSVGGLVFGLQSLLDGLNKALFAALHVAL